MQPAISQDIMNAAQQKAQQEHKLILLKFSGSDWCIPCIRMEKEIFENVHFKSMADTGVVLVKADFPRKKKNLPAKEIVLQNEKLAERFNPGGSFPLMVLMDAHQKIIKVWDGMPEGSASSFAATVGQFVHDYRNTD